VVFVSKKNIKKNFFGIARRQKIMIADAIHARFHVQSLFNIHARKTGDRRKKLFSLLSILKSVPEFP
jgi:hypothetical protein